MASLRDLLLNCDQAPQPIYHRAGNAAEAELGPAAAALIRWDTTETDHRHTACPDRLYGHITGDDHTLTLFYQDETEPGLPTIFICVTCPHDPTCALGAVELTSHGLAVGYLDDFTPGMDAFCPIHD